MALLCCRYAPEPDMLLTTTYYHRTKEQQMALGFLAETDAPTEEVVAEPSITSDIAVADGNQDGTRQCDYIPAGTTKLPHGSVGALSAHHTIAQASSTEMAAAIFKYSGPEEVTSKPFFCIKSFETAILVMICRSLISSNRS